ncbi:hydrogenase maturation nickel metallochaperone HypA [Thauera aromatica]|uniref:hydrogenase maturation nickel metallochaperone HypA n=1 Tax=Thauera aromatica TaxID=59405 RepID=UPI001FFCF3E1|nr:hydrogenase maturation nickel metallochaperone HypA [Thauera aromatica]MCK2088221.1 hydrogenase maturation nickel metallochaperone HypA [Thauera aromatica]MCK2126790.1 hydrogenase maturation nickel metallochaperone HypA [Thauera aromatica]
MHELSLAEGVREIIDEAAAAQRFRHVRTIILEIGELAAVETESLQFCLALVLRGTLAEGATIQVETVAGSGRCPGCGQTVALRERYAPCPECGGFGVEPRAGTGMRVRALEVA